MTNPLGLNQYSWSEGRRILMIGSSSTTPCGVRDYACVLEAALSRKGVAVETLWWERSDAWSTSRTWRELGAWLQAVQEFVSGCERPDAILCHYSVFTWSLSGIPIYVGRLVRSLGRLGVPVVVLFHELAYPFRRGDWRGTVWALTQRAVLPLMLRVSSGALVTTDDRAVWLSTRFWLPKINVSVVPVCSNVPVPCGRQVRMTRNIGVFGFGGESFSPAVVMQALARVASEDSRIQLVLVGSPGEESTQGRRWRRVALEVGCESHVSFTGVLDAERLQDVLLGIQVMVFPDVSGPTSRKTTLAAALACGKAIVALDGPQRWEGLVRAKAVVLARDWEEVGAAISALYSDPALRGRQEKAALDFYREHMSEDVVAAKVQKFLAGIG